MQKQVIVIGSGGHASVVIDILQEMSDVNIIGITSVGLTKGDEFLGYPVLGNDDVIREYLNLEGFYAVMGIGGYKDNYLREKVFLFVKKMGVNFLNAIHPSSIISKTVQIGQGVVVFPGVIINTNVKIGDNCIIATNSSIDHETIIEDNTLVSAGVIIGAYSKICNNVVLALGAKVISGVTIYKNVLVAAGAVVVNNIEENKKVFGIPAKEK